MIPGRGEGTDGTPPSGLGGPAEWAWGDPSRIGPSGPPRRFWERTIGGGGAGGIRGRARPLVRSLVRWPLRSLRREAAADSRARSPSCLCPTIRGPRPGRRTRLSPSCGLLPLLCFWAHVLSRVFFGGGGGKGRIGIPLCVNINPPPPPLGFLWGLAFV